MTIKQAAKLYRKSERTIKRWKSLGYPIENETEMVPLIVAMNSRRGCRKFIGRPSIVAPQEPEAPAADDVEAPGTLAQFEGRFLATHTQIAMLRYEIRDSHPEIAAKLTEILAKNQPWVDWLDSD
jgi:hypothetical protein